MRISVGDVHLFFDVDGQSLRPDGPRMRGVPTLLLLHGGPFIDHSMFKPEYSQLADVAQLIYVDHRGCGRSDRGSPNRWNLDQWGEDVRAFCDALEIQRPIVMGVSFGGFVAMSYATRYPEHPSAIVLCSTMGKWRDDRSLSAFQKLGGDEAREAARRFWEDPTVENSRAYSLKCGPLCLRLTQGKRPNLTLTQISSLMSRFSRPVTNWDINEFFIRGEKRTFDFLPILNRIACPTLVLSGEADPIATVADFQDIVDALPDELRQYELFPDAGHGIVDDTPQPFFARLRRFISDTAHHRD